MFIVCKKIFIYKNSSKNELIEYLFKILTLTESSEDIILV